MSRVKKELVLEDAFIQFGVYHVTLKLLKEGVKKQVIVPMTIEFKLSNCTFDELPSRIKNHMDGLNICQSSYFIFSLKTLKVYHTE